LRFSTTMELMEAVQELALQMIPDDVELTKEMLWKLADAILAKSYQVASNGQRQYLQTVRIIREQRVWVPITIHVQTDETGLVDFVRIHSPKSIVERKRNEPSA
jgi:hypothetical protein